MIASGVFNASHEFRFTGNQYRRDGFLGSFSMKKIVGWVCILLRGVGRDPKEEGIDFVEAGWIALVDTSA